MNTLAFIIFIGFPQLIVSQTFENVRVINRYNDSVDIAWDAITNVTLYAVNIVVVDFPSQQILPPRYTNVAQYTLDNITPSSRAVVGIKAIQFNGVDASASETISTTSLLSFAANPASSRPIISGVNIMQVKENTFLVSWNAYENTTNYSVIYNTDSYEGRTSTQNTSLTITTDSCTVSFRVEAIEINGAELLFPIKSATNNFEIPQVGNIQVVNVYKDGIDLSWQSVPTAVQYKIQLPSNNTMLRTAQTQISIDDIQMNSDHTVVISVAQYNNKAMYACRGNSFNFSTSTTASRPSVKNIKLKESAERAIRFEWEHLENATLYNVSYRISGRFDSRLTNISEINLDGLNCNTLLTVRVEVIRLSNMKMPQFPILSDDIKLATAHCSSILLARPSLWITLLVCLIVAKFV